MFSAFYETNVKEKLEENNYPTRNNGSENRALNIKIKTDTYNTCTKAALQKNMVK